MAKQGARKKKPGTKPSRVKYHARQISRGWDGNPRRVGGVWLSGRAGRHGTE